MKDIRSLLDDFCKKYLFMDISGQRVNCPYWENKLEDKKVKIRGFMNGKGDAVSIENELNRLIKRKPQDKKLIQTRFGFEKFAKRNRIGIDCSGLVYRILDYLVKNSYSRKNLTSLDQIFTAGINRTNADKLTSQEYSLPIKAMQDFRIGDMIRINNGKHIMVIIEVEDNKITYIHSSRLSEIRGVHVSEIFITDKNKTIFDQEWTENSKDGFGFKEKYYKAHRGDGLYRLKAFV